MDDKEKLFLKNIKNALFIFAHPDDEAFTCAGTINLIHKLGANIELVCYTRGEEGSVGEPQLCLPEELGEKRTSEIKCSAKILGINKLYFLGLRDGSLSGFSTKYLANLLEPIIQRIRPDTVFTYVSTGISGHDDHIAVNKAVTKVYKNYRTEENVIANLFYATLPDSLVEKMRKEKLIKEIFKNPFKGTPDEKIDIKINVKKVLKNKIKALKCHQTQHRDWERFLKRQSHGFQDFEYFKMFPDN